jgi:hypothetical protein
MGRGGRRLCRGGGWVDVVWGPLRSPWHTRDGYGRARGDTIAVWRGKDFCRALESEREILLDSILATLVCSLFAKILVAPFA